MNSLELIGFEFAYKSTCNCDGSKTYKYSYSNFLIKHRPNMPNNKNYRLLEGLNHRTSWVSFQEVVEVFDGLIKQKEKCGHSKSVN